MIRRPILVIDIVGLVILCVVVLELVGCGGGRANVTSSSLLSVSPKIVSVATGQSQQFFADITGDPGNLGLIWSVDGLVGGDTTVGTISWDGTYAPPVTGGIHTVAVTSTLGTRQSATAIIAVTDLPGVFTFHNNLARDGANTQEYALRPGNVNATMFGKVFSCSVDGAIYTQPLWVPNLRIDGRSHNAVLVATEHDSLYAFDADSVPCVQLWRENLISVEHRATDGEIPVSYTEVGFGGADIYPEIGVTGTPVIDPASNTLYVVSKSENGRGSFYQRLHAIDLLTGKEKFNGPTDIVASLPGTGDDSLGGRIPFNPWSQLQRCALALVDGVVYISWASHGDRSPFHGWILGYDASDIRKQVNVFNTTPNSGLGGIWMSGSGPAADNEGHLFVATGNGNFDEDLNDVPPRDLGDSILKLNASTGLALTDWFTPNDELNLSLYDIDLGSGGVVLLPDQSSGPVPHLLVTGGKEGTLYLVDRDNMGKFKIDDNSQIVENFSINVGLFGTPAFWENRLYVGGSYGSVELYTFAPSIGQFETVASAQTYHIFPWPGTTPSISSQGSMNGILWAVDEGAFGGGSGTGPVVLYAFDAVNLGQELWDSSQAANDRDRAGFAVKFVPPTIANGRVYVSTRTEIDVYGLLPN